MTDTNPYLGGNFGPIGDEITADDLPVVGEIPAELDGLYVRTGPNPVTPPDPATYHWFIGDGMLHGVRLQDGQASWYRNRWVRTDDVATALGEEPIEGPTSAMFESSNTNVVRIAGRLYSVTETCTPHEITAELDTLRRHDFGGPLPFGFSPHPRVHPRTGEIHAASYGIEPPFAYHNVISVDGEVLRTDPVDVAGPTSMHTMAVTDRWAAFFDLPAVFDIEAAMAGAGFPWRWNVDYEARVGVRPIEGGDTTWLTIDPCYVFHVVNGFDVDESQLVLDVVQHPSIFAEDTRGPDDGPPTLHRWTIDVAAGAVKDEQLDDRPGELPRIDPRRHTDAYRFGYLMGLSKGEDQVLFEPTALLKHDADTRRMEVHDFGPGRGPGEPTFVPRSADGAEDDGWVMTFVYDAAEDTSELVILAAADFTGVPVARVQLPRRVPNGFHGDWFPAPL